MIEFKGNKVTLMACSDCNIDCKPCYISYKGSFNPNELKIIDSTLDKSYFVTINGSELLIVMKDGIIKKDREVYL